VKGREIGNLGLHIGVGGALTALVMWHVLLVNLVVFVFAFLREQAQHRYILTRSKGWAQGVHAVEKRGFFDFSWLGWKQVREILQWELGSLAVSLPWYFFG